ncbi:MAG: hypothetical protein ACR2JC_20885 [Chloroflexota bacterium]
MPLITDLLQPDRLTLQLAAPQTSNGSGATVTVGQYRELVAFVQVTAVSGTSPQLNVFLDASPDGGSTWVQVAQLGPANIAATGAYLVTLTPGGAAGGSVISTGFGDTIRIRWTIAGTTPSFTFSVLAVGK